MLIQVRVKAVKSMYFKSSIATDDANITEVQKGPLN